MSAIDDLEKAKAATYSGVWSWERHGGGWALYVDRGQPLFPHEPRGICNIQHGLNILTVGSDGFDSRGEQLRAFILEAGMKVPLLAAERDVERAAWARLVKAALDEVSTTEAREALRAMGVDVDSLLEGS